MTNLTGFRYHTASCSNHFNQFDKQARLYANASNNYLARNPVMNLSLFSH